MASGGGRAKRFLRATSPRALARRLRGWSGIDQLALALVLATLVLFVVLGKTGPAGLWTWSVHASEKRRAPFQAPTGALLVWDIVLITLYVASAFAVHSGTRCRTNRIVTIDEARFHPLAKRLERWSETGLVFLVAAGAADIAENVLGAWLHPSGDRGGWLIALQVSTWVKLTALAAGVLALAVTALAGAVRAHDLASRCQDSAPPPDPLWHAGRAENPPGSGWDPAPGRVGVCLSGGGIRSASFSLGALQAVARSRMGGIRYVTSVSGGGYMAAAWAALTPMGAPKARPRPFLSTSPEERWVRHNTNYLISSGGAMVGAFVTLVGGFLLNALIVLFVLQAMAHPLGWAIAAAHPETKAKTPIIEIVHQPRLQIGRLIEVHNAELPTAVPDCANCVPDRATGFAYEVPLDWLDTGPRGLDLESSATVASTLRRVIPRVRLDIQSGLVAEGANGLIVIRQPLVSIGAPAYLPLPGITDPPVGDRIQIRSQPRIAIAAVPEISGGSEAAGGATLRLSQVQALVRIDRQPSVSQESGTLGRDPLSYPAWQVWFVLSFFAIALVARSLPRYGENQRAVALAKLGTAAALLVFAAPWVTRNLPGWLSRLTGFHSSAGGWGAAGGLLVVAVPLALKAWGTLRKKIGFLKQFRGRPLVLDVALGVVVITVGVMVFLLLVDLASANGPAGRLTGLQDVFFIGHPTDFHRWLVVITLLAGMLLGPILPSHHWSLYEIYRSRLASAYFLDAHDARAVEPLGTSDPRRYRVARMRRGRQLGWRWWVEDPAADAPSTRLGGLSSDRPFLAGTMAEWVVCTTANIRGAGEAAPGRRAGSFTFSRDWVGGPEVGWMATPDYLKRLRKGRALDVSVPSTVTISGAAFSPAMGKSSQGWRGRLFALANLRLGVWVANPMVVARGEGDEKFGRFRRPGMAWYLRELVGWFDRTAPYVYLTDGGHWENLGLVELLRRGCTDVWVISAAGDGHDSFETFAQAIALAREELGVEIDIEVEGLRPAEKAVAGPRRLLRAGAAVGTAPAAFAKGRFRYPDSGPWGTIHVVEAALLGDLPWDVHAYAEANADFPDIATGYQLMDHRDFEAYRMLGYTQAARALHDVGLWPADDPLVAPPERPRSV